MSTYSAAQMFEIIKLLLFSFLFKKPRIYLSTGEVEHFQILNGLFYDALKRGWREREVWLDINMNF